MWQDIVLSVGGLGFSLALLPSVLRKVKMPLATPLVTAVILTLYAVVYASFSLWYGFTTQTLTAGMWWYLVYVAVRRK